MKHPDILKQLTLEQKVALLSGKDVWSTYAFPQAGVPSMVMSDGPHGLRRQLGRGDHLGQRPSQPATCFPTAACLAGSWDPALLEEVGRALGTEAAAQGVHMLLGPGMNLKRSPLGGRNFEYFSEDPYLSGKLAAALVRGVQSQGAAACVKHFAANSQELLRMTSDSVVDERTFRELYLTGFEIAVKEGRPLGVMSSYNRVNGTYANENPHLLTEILREEWGFTGMVVTDWGACNRQVDGLRAGSNLEMPGTQGDSDREVLSALDRGELTEDVIDRRVDELLDVVLATTEAARTAPKHFDEAAHHALARRAAAESAVLLKNEDSLLPLAPGTKVAVLGDLALEPRYQGAGSSLVRPTRLDRPLDCLKESGLNVIGHAKAYRRNGQPSERLEREAAELARRAEAVLLFLGIPECFESEGLDRDHLALPDNQVRALEAVAQANPNVVVVLAGGGALELPWLDRCKALLHGYLGGQAGAGAAADLLTGKVDPSGRLAETFPLVLADAPNARYFPGRERTAEYREGLFVGYRYYQTVGKPVAFPFGFGLSYTTFAYSDLSVRRDGVSFTLTNTGTRAGSEVAQVYLTGPRDRVFRPALELKGFQKVALRPGAEVAQMYVTGPRDRVFRPALELKGFQKVTLQPGESRRVTIPLDGYAFRWFNPRTNQWEVEGGTYRISVGPNAGDLPLSAALEVEGTDPGAVYDKKTLACYFSGQVEDVPDGAFQALLGRPIPEAKWDRSAPLTLEDSFYQLSYARGRAARFANWVLGRMAKRKARLGEPDPVSLFIRNMPFRGLVKLSNGLADTKFALGALDMANGHGFRGFFRALSAFASARLEHRRRKKRLGL